MSSKETLQDLSKRGDWDELVCELKRRDLLQHYYIVQFRYRGRTVMSPGEYPESDQAVKHNEMAYFTAKTTIEKLGWEWKHAYSWPDGSLYLYVMTLEEEVSTVTDKINDLLPEVMQVGNVGKLPPQAKTMGEKAVCALFMCE